jgi:hypothetical protein
MITTRVIRQRPHLFFVLLLVCSLTHDCTALPRQVDEDFFSFTPVDGSPSSPSPRLGSSPPSPNCCMSRGCFIILPFLQPGSLPLGLNEASSLADKTHTLTTAASHPESAVVPTTTYSASQSMTPPRALSDPRTSLREMRCSAGVSYYILAFLQEVFGASADPAISGRHHDDSAVSCTSSIRSGYVTTQEYVKTSAPTIVGTLETLNVETLGRCCQVIIFALVLGAISLCVIIRAILIDKRERLSHSAMMGRKFLDLEL